MRRSFDGLAALARNHLARTRRAATGSSTCHGRPARPPDRSAARALDGGRLCERCVPGPTRSRERTRGVCRNRAGECREGALRSHEAPASRRAGSNAVARPELRPACRSGGHGDRRIAVHVGRFRTDARPRGRCAPRSTRGIVAAGASRPAIRRAHRGRQESACRSPLLEASIRNLLRAPHCPACDRDRCVCRVTQLPSSSGKRVWKRGDCRSHANRRLNQHQASPDGWRSKAFVDSPRDAHR